LHNEQASVCKNLIPTDSALVVNGESGKPTSNKVKYKKMVSKTNMTADLYLLLLPKAEYERMWG